MAENINNSWWVEETAPLEADLIPPTEGGFTLPSQIASGNFTQPISSISDFNIGISGKLYGGQSAYDTGTGVWLGLTGGAWKFSLGNSAGNKLTWNGTTLSITGNLTATAGSIGGWTIGATSLTAGTGATTVGLDSGGTNPALYAGSATPASAPFRVSNAGKLTASDIVATGTINAQAGYLSAGVYVDTANAIVCESAGLNVGVAGHIRGGQTDYNVGAGFFLGYDSAAYKLSIGNSADTSNLLLWDGTNLIVNGTTLLFQSIFGDGSDGDATISSNTNLTRDMYYNNLTITGSSIWLNPAGFRIFVKGILTIAATCRIQRDGNNGGNASTFTGGTGGTALAAGSLVGGIAGVAGGNGGIGGNSSGGAAGIAGTAGNAAAKSIGGAARAGVTGGAGGSGWLGAGGSGGAAGALGAQTGTVYNTMKCLATTYFMSDTQSSTLTNFTGSPGTGGSGGGGGGTSSAPGVGGNGGGGGGSGSCGGVIWIAAKSIVLNGDITAYGGTGGNGANGANAASGDSGGGGGGGGGCGGTGGVVVVIYNSKTGAGTIVAPGGSAGTRGTGGAKSGTGTVGTDGTVGASGNAGVTLSLIV